MARIRHTHGYDLLYKFFLMFGGIFLLCVVGAILSPVAGPIEKYLKQHHLEWINIIIMLVFFIGGYCGAIALIVKTTHWLPTYLHVRLSLFTPINVDEAKKLSFLFDGSMGGRWYPLGDVRKIPKGQRREALFVFANRTAESQGWCKPFRV